MTSFAAYRGEGKTSASFVFRMQASRGAGDPTVLEWTAQEGRVLLTHDVTTITHHAYERVRAGKPMPGVFEAGRNLPVGAAIRDILLLVEYSLDGEWEAQVRYLPLR